MVDPDLSPLSAHDHECQHGAEGGDVLQVADPPAQELAECPGEGEESCKLTGEAGGTAGQSRDQG